MSSGSRARAMDYAKTTRNVKVDSRKRAMPDNFGKPTDPSSAHVSSELMSRDDKADETRSLRNEEKELRNDAEKDVIDTKNFKVSDNNGQAPAPTRTTTNEPAAAPELKSAFSKCWTTVDENIIPSITHFDKSSYVPLGLNLFQILFAMEDMLNGNEELRWINPMYFSLPVRVYYAVIFFVQTLRAKDASGTLSKSDSSFLRAFLRRFKDTACPIAGPLVPYFTNITSCLPDDKQFDYVSPSLPKRGTYSVTRIGEGAQATVQLTVDPLHHVIPSVPLIGSLLKLFCTTNDLRQYFSPSGEFVPVPTTGGQFAGIDFPPQTGNQWTNSFAQVLNNPAMMRPLPESDFKLLEIHAQWRRSGVRHFPDIPTNTSFDPQDPSGHTQLLDNFDWFETCINMAATQVRFFSDSTNLSQIPVLGGRSTLIVSHITVVNPSDNNDLPRPTAASNWYPDTFSSLKACFDAFTPKLEQPDMYNAIYSLTNGTLNWVTPGGSPIGSKDAVHRSGPYWDNQKKTFELASPTKVSAGLYNMVQTHFYNARPNGK
uniref:Coat protein n=1 Tax=Plasmopara viticola lesion associated Partitivirus 9 TaxID=2692007 RepID=A0A6B9Q759_9VIRU|nr:coat protein [Plasmopara viticola lesion associated Partitivirus 9]